MDWIDLAQDWDRCSTSVNGNEYSVSMKCWEVFE
jgi:hypothetical protein